MKARYTVLLASMLYAGAAFAQEVPTHTVKPGETLYRIATTNGMSVDSLKRLNQLSDNIIKVGQVLVLAPRDDTREAAEPEVADEPEDAPFDPSDFDRPRDVDDPLIEGPPAADPLLAAGSESASEYVVQEGETLFSIAADLGTKAYILFTMNGGIRGPLRVGQTVLVPRRAISYLVRSGDSRSELAADAGGKIPPVYAAGEVTVFPNTYAGRAMANGEAYDPADYVVSHRELPFDTILLMENPVSGVVTFARVADRGPLDEDHLMDVSEAVARHLGLVDGRRIVRVRLVE